MTTLTKDQAKAFVTKDDLDQLEKLIEAEMLQADLVGRPIPTIIVRGVELSLFDILELLGTV